MSEHHPINNIQRCPNLVWVVECHPIVAGINHLMVDRIATNSKGIIITIITIIIGTHLIRIAEDIHRLSILLTIQMCKAEAIQVLSGRLQEALHYTIMFLTHST